MSVIHAAAFIFFYVPCFLMTFAIVLHLKYTNGQSFVKVHENISLAAQSQGELGWVEDTLVLLSDGACPLKLALFMGGL